MGVHIRHPRPDELHTLDILKEFHSLPLDGQWIWLAEQDDKVLGMAMASPMHGILFLMRMLVVEDAPPTIALSLIKRMGKDSKARGCFGYMCLLDPKQPAEMKLGRFFQRLPETKFVPYQGIIATGRIDGRLFQ